MASETVDAAIDVAVRDDAGRVVAALTRRFARLDVADDAVQDALITAARRWPVDGVPDNPGGWLHVVARRNLLDRLRREAAADRRLAAVAADLVDLAASPAAEAGPTDEFVEIDDETEPGDDRLRLLLLCCHPALSTEAQVALTLRLVAGLTTEEIARAFLVSTSTLAQRISRAKAKIRTAGIPMSMPANISDRLGAVLSVIHLTFNEGYLSRSGTSGPQRLDLCAEAIRLAGIVAHLTPDEPEPRGLLASMLYIHARRDARIVHGALVTLAEQDRGLWYVDEIRTANRMLKSAMDLARPGPFQIEALIGSYHANARVASDTDWSRIAALYATLEALRPSPVVSLNRAVAVGMADGPLPGLRALDAVTGLDDYHLVHAARGEFLADSGDVAGALLALRRAEELTDNPVELDHLRDRIARLSERGVD